MRIEQMLDRRTVAVIGLGYVGLPLALRAAAVGHGVIGIDTDPEKLAAIRVKRIPFADSDTAREIKRVSLEVTDDFSAIRHADIVAVCVPTPVRHDYTPDLRPVENAMQSIAQHLKRGHLIILESTVNPGVSRTIVLEALEKSGLADGHDFYLAHCPERINPGDTRWTVKTIPRVVGSTSAVGVELAASFYETILEVDKELFTESVTRVDSIEEAEASKILENTFRMVNIALMNEFATVARELDVDAVNVIRAAATKPFGFMAHYPGCGVGGHCIPVDPWYLVSAAEAKGLSCGFIRKALDVNIRMTDYTAKLVTEGLNEKRKAVNGSRIAVLGLSYKAGIGDCRESPAPIIVRHLEKMGAGVVTFDPHAPGESTVPSLDDAVRGADAAVIATDHAEFVRLPPSFFLKRGVSVIVDGRNCLSKRAFIEAGAIYKGIGR